MDGDAEARPQQPLRKRRRKWLNEEEALEIDLEGVSEPPSERRRRLRALKKLGLTPEEIRALYPEPAKGTVQRNKQPGRTKRQKGVKAQR